MSFLRKLFAQNGKTESSYKDLIEKSVDIFFVNYEEPDVIADEIQKLNASDEEATILYLFIPHVFCRIFLPEIQYSEFYIITNKDGKDEHVNFSDSVIFNEMISVINANWNIYIGRDIMKILFHSGDFRAANQMLGKGSKLENLKSIPPRIATRQRI